MARAMAGNGTECAPRLGAAGPYVAGNRANCRGISIDTHCPDSVARA